MDIINKIAIKLFNYKVGSDEFGNQYFQSKNKKRRFVIYKGSPEATKIPSEWRVWIHHQCDDVPSHFKIKKYFWQKMYLPNLTGTQLAYSPKKDQERKSAYEAWTPKI